MFSVILKLVRDVIDLRIRSERNGSFATRLVTSVRSSVKLSAELNGTDPVFSMYIFQKAMFLLQVDRGGSVEDSARL